MSTAGNTGPLAKEVYGYFVQNGSVPSEPSLAANFQHLTGITPWSFSIDAQGNVIAQADTAALAKTLQFAGKRELKTLALISNYDKKTESFSGALAHKLLQSPANRQRAVESIYRTVVDWGLTGVNIDFEHVYPEDREYYSQFLRELSTRLRPAGILVTVAIPAKTADNPKASWSGAFDYQTIGEAVDRVMLMAYDQHYASGAPGPIASIDGLTKCCSLPHPKLWEKVILGIAGYAGYSWAKPGIAHSVTCQKAVELAAKGTGVRWDATHQSTLRRVSRTTDVV